MESTVVAYLLMFQAAVAHYFTRDIVGQTFFQETPNLTTISNGVVRVGIDSNRGGSITYFALADRNESIVNVHDMGREVQLSFYSGPEDYEPNPGSDKCKSKWRPQGNWPWNPIGAGDVAGNVGEVLVLEKNDQMQTIYVKSRPLQWSCDSVPCECTFEKWISIDGHAANVRARLVNNRSDRTVYPAHSQELPAVYTTGSYYRIFTYNGTKPFTNEKLTEFNTTGKIWTPGFFLASESWAAMVNDSLWGLGVFQPFTNRVSGGFSGQHGDYGPLDDQTGYLAPNHDEILDYNIVYDFNFSIILGTVQEIRDYVYQHTSGGRVCLDYHFTRDRQHFYYVNAADTGPPNGVWHVIMEKDDPQIIGPTCVWTAEDYPELIINSSYSASLGHNNPGQVFFNVEGLGPKFDEQHSVSFPIIADGQFHEYKVNLSSNPQYKGAMFGIRFDPIASGKPGAYVEIASILVHG